MYCTICYLTPYPPYTTVYGSRICGTAPKAPRAAGDRPRGPRTTVRMCTKDI